MRLTSTLAAAAALALSVSACAESVESNDVLTDGIYAELRAASTEDGTSVTATLLVGGADSNTFVRLTGDDALTATAGSETRTLASRNLGDRYFYTTDLEASTGDTEVIFRFERTIDDGAPDSRCTMPAAVAITGPTGDAAVSRADSDLVITWTPGDADDTLQLDIEGDCIQGYGTTLDDSAGTHTLPAGTLVSASDLPAACQSTIRLTRQRSGMLDPAFGEGGSVVCSQRRETSFRSDP